MSATSAATRGRLLAEAQMTSTCTVRGTSTGTVTDPDTGEVAPVVGAVVYSGKCRVRPGGRGTQTNTASTPGGELFVFDYLISIPFAASDVTEGHRVTIDDSPDPALNGVEVEVQKVDRGDHISARRLACLEVS